MNYAIIPAPVVSYSDSTWYKKFRFINTQQAFMAD